MLAALSLGGALAAVPLLIALNAFFVVAEYAVVAVRPAELDALRRRGRTRAAAAMQRLKADPAGAIGTIQVCITMTNLLLGWIGEPAMSALLERLLGPLIRLWPATFTAVSTILSFLVVTLLTVVLSELLPKALTLRYVLAAATLTATPILALRRGLRPLVWLMNTLANAITRPLGLGRVDADDGSQRVTVDEVRFMTQQAAAQGTLTARERSLILNSLALGRRAAREIMVPRVRVAYLDVRRSMAENRRITDEYLYTRLPVCDGGMDHVVGVVQAKEFLTAFYGEEDAAESTVLTLIARPPVFVPETAKLDQLLATFGERRTQFAFLVDEYGGVEGIVTLRDVVDELFADASEGEEDDAIPLVR